MRRITLLLAAVAALMLAPAAHAQDPGSAVLPPGPLAFTEGNPSPAWVYTVQPSGADLDYLTAGTLPAFSPNGKQIATIGLNGGVYVSAVNGTGGARKVATQTSIGLNYGPAAWSPTGRQLAYTADGDVYVVSAKGGRPRRVYSQGLWQDEATHPVFSKSGRAIYFLALNQGLSAEVPVYEVMRVPVSGKGRPVAIQPAIPPATPDWALTPFSLSLSPSGNTLAVTLAQRATPAPGSSAAPYDAYAVGLWPASGNGGVTVLPGFSAAAWAPNGQQLCANQTGGGLVVLDSGGAVTATPVPASAEPAACTWLP